MCVCVLRYVTLHYACSLWKYVMYVCYLCMRCMLCMCVKLCSVIMYACIYVLLCMRVMYLCYVRALSILCV